MNVYLKVFRVLTWIGILVNLGFALPALLGPDFMETLLGPGAVELSYLWFAAAGMLLLVASVLYVPAAKDPQRYHVYAWLSVVGRGVAAAFWLWQNQRWGLPGPVRNFWMTDGAFCVVFLVLLQLGLPADRRISAANLAHVVASWRWRPAANGAALAFRLLVWLGLLLDLAFAAAALCAPAWLSQQLGTTNVAFTYLWLGNCGMLLVQRALFSLPAARDPLRYHVYAWLLVAARFVAVVFWWAQNARWHLSGVASWLWLPALVLAVAQAAALQRALPRGHGAAVQNVVSWIASLFRDVAAAFPNAVARVVGVVALGALAFVGYGAWSYLGRALPEESFADPGEQFKYGAIGLGQANRVPLYLWRVMPGLCADLLPDGGRDGWAALGLIYEPGRELPVGFARRQIGYPSVEPNCGLCHTSSYRTAEGAPRQVILGGPAHELDLQSFQWFLYDCAASDAFTVDKVMAAIAAREELSWMEEKAYRYAIVPFAQSGLATQRQAYQWQRSRPQQGRGRTDTFNPTKIVVFHQPDDGSIGTVDLPAIWNQRARVGLWLHWDGNNNDIHERNFAAAMAVGATPYSVIDENFARVTDFVLDLAPPKYPFAVDQVAAQRGWTVFQAECAGCHALGSERVGTVTPHAEIGTDRHRLDSFTPALVATFHSIAEGPFRFDAYRKTEGYSNLPIDGAWARAPYLHNGSVPTLRDLLSAPELRPTHFERGGNLVDGERVGFLAGPPQQGAGFVQDASVPGNGNGGHTYGVRLSEEEKRDLLEYLKTL